MKNIILLLSLSAILILTECSKKSTHISQLNSVILHDTLAHHAVDFRDSIVGTYNCTNHHVISFRCPGGGFSDSIIDTVSIVVSKIAANDSFIIIGGNTCSYLGLNGSISNYLGGTGAQGLREIASFISNDSICYTYSILNASATCGKNEYYYYTGHK